MMKNNIVPKRKSPRIREENYFRSGIDKSQNLVELSINIKIMVLLKIASEGLQVFP